MRKISCYTFLLLCGLVMGSLPNLARAQTLREDPFSIGVYMYGYQMAAAAAEQGKTYSDFFEEHMALLKANGVNALYFATVGGTEFSESLSLAKQYGMTLIPQLELAYFNPSWSDSQMDAAAQIAGNFINAYDGDSSILAWSVKEEVFPSNVNRLAEYYTKIREVAPNAKFNLVHNNINSAQNQPAPDPAISGVDRYSFWWEVSAGGYLASPAFALNWAREQAALFQPESEQRGADFMFVTTQGGFMLPSYANQIANDASNPALMAKVRLQAAEGRMGWKVYDTLYGERFNVWKYYRTPKNATKAQAWIGVLEGAKLVFNWSYDPQNVNTDFEQAVSQETIPNEVFWYTLAGRSGLENPELAEFAEVSQEIREYEQIIMNMTKLSDSPVETQEAFTYANAFSFPGLLGKIVVVQNSNVGTWPTNKFFFDDDDPIFIDDEGNLTGYVPFTDTMTVNIAFQAGETPVGVFDIATGTQILPQGSNYGLEILPGSGKLIFLGTSAEAQTLFDLFGTVGPVGLAGDFDNDNDVDGADFLLWQRVPGVGGLADWEPNFGEFGESAGLAAASVQVPEPAGMPLILLNVGVAAASRAGAGKKIRK